MSRRARQRGRPNAGADGVVPNFAALIEVLITLRCLPDGLGETKLDKREAAKIRACGFEARASSKWMWRCPPLPDELVWWNPFLRHLSDAIDPRSRPGPWHPRRAAPRRIAQEYPLRKLEIRIIDMLNRPPYYSLSKRQLQQKLWRIPARFFNHLLGRMIAENRITFDNGLLYPFGRETFDWAYRDSRSVQRSERLLSSRLHHSARRTTNLA